MSHSMYILFVEKDKHCSTVGI